MFLKTIKKVNWAYAIGEIVLIFLGITMAIWFNNWNEIKKARKVEIQSLIEVTNAVEQDLKDIEENIHGYAHRVILYKQLATHIEQKLPLTDSLRKILPYMQGLTTFLPNTGPYETLKSRGLETISNDGIRLKISLYYDFNYEKIEVNERQHFDHFMNYLKPVIMENFKFLGNKFEPNNYEALMNDVEFQQAIYWALRTDSYMLRLYENLEKKGKELVVELKQEKERLL